MTKKEFEEKVQEVSSMDFNLLEDSFSKRPNVNCLSEHDWKVIERVYQSYPLISETQGKKQIAFIYVYFGMPVIYDMLSRAEKAMVLESQIIATNNKLSDLKTDYESLKTKKV